MPFGQGVTSFEQAAQTPVVVCCGSHEGGWGSFAYRGGPPMKRKPLDWRRQN